MTKDGRAKIEEMAQKAGMSVAEFMRKASLGEKITILEHAPTSPDVKAEIQRIGAGLNDIAKAINSGQPYSQAELDRYCQDLNVVLDGFLKD